MKKVLIVFVSLCMIFAVSCQKENAKSTEKITETENQKESTSQKTTAEEKSGTMVIGKDEYEVISDGDKDHIHSLTEIERLENNCGKDGYIIYSCTCGLKLKKVLPKTNEHMPSQDGVFPYVCPVCGQTVRDSYETPVIFY